MTPELIEQIDRARRELRLASGEPLTPEELEHEKRRKALEALEPFCGRLSLDSRMAILPQAVWSKGMAACEITIEDRTFYLRPDGDMMRVFQPIKGDTDEVLLATMKRGDSQFVNRLLVTLGDAMQENQ